MKHRQWPNMRKLSLVVLIVGATISIILQLLFPPKSGQIPPELKGVLLQQARPLKPLQLKDHDGNPFDLARFKGRWTFLFFGYTHCPDVCPVTLGLLASVFGQLEKPIASGEAEPQGIFVSVDPERDTLASLKEYVAYFNKAFVGVSGDKAHLAAFAKQVGASYMRAAPTERAGDYTVNHSSSVFLIDPKARLISLFYPNLLTDKQIVQRFERIRSLYQEGDLPWD